MFKVLIFFAILFFELSLFSSQLSLIQSCYLNREYAKCIRLCRKKIKEEQRDIYYYILGLSYLQTGYLEEARQSFKKLLEKFPNSDLANEAVLGIGDTYLYTEEFKKALKFFKRLLITQKDYAPLYLRIAKTFLKLGKWKEAENYLYKIISKFPNSCFSETAKELIGEGFYFSVQVGAFKYKENASKLCRELKERGFKAYIKEKKSQQGIIYRVRVGKEKKKNKIEKIKSRLLELGFPATIYP